MLDLFTEETYFTKSISITSNPVVERLILKQLEIYKEYMKDRNYYVSNNNPFVSILNNGIPSTIKDMTKEELYFNVKNNIEYLSSVIGCTSNRSKGKYFTDNKLTYLILLDNDDTNIEDKDYDVVKVLYTDYCKLDFSHGTEEETMIIKLNPTELILDFVEWEKQRVIYDLPSSYNTYVATRLLPKLWDTKINFVIFNRLINIFYNIDNPKFKNKLPIQILNVDNMLDNDLIRINKLIVTQRKLDIRTLLNSFKYVNIKLKTILDFDKYMFTSTSLWIVWLTRIEYIRYFVDLSSVTDSNNTNNEYIKTMFTDIKRFENRNTVMINLPEELHFNFYVDYDYIKEKIKYNL